MSSFNKDAVIHAEEDGETLGIEHFITCPYCGWENHDTWECGMDDGDVEEVECGHCEKTFKVSCSVSRTFQSTRIPQESEPEHCVNVILSGHSPEEIAAAPFTFENGLVTLRAGKAMPSDLVGAKIVFDGRVVGTILSHTYTVNPLDPATAPAPVVNIQNQILRVGCSPEFKTEMTECNLEWIEKI
jgi:hypothetical protein